MTAIDGNLASDLSRLATEIEELLSVTADGGDERVAAAREQIEATLRRAQAVAREFSDELSAKARKTAGEVDDYVHHHPWSALAVAGTFGLVVGFLLGRK